MTRLLIVGDEPAGVRALERTLQRRFSICSAGSAEEGDRLLRTFLPRIVLARFIECGTTRMGEEFLATVAAASPSTLRVLMSAGTLSDRRRVEKAGATFFETPLGDEQLLALLESIEVLLPPIAQRRYRTGES